MKPVILRLAAVSWSGGGDGGLIHRSAPVRHRHDHRIRLCIDLPDACNC